MPELYPRAASLAESARLADRAEYEAEAARAPGGEYVVAHIYDGPFYLVTLSNFYHDDADFKATAVISAFPPIELILNQGCGPERMLLLAVPKYGKQVLEWYADGESSYSVSEIELPSYDHPPTDRDLAVALPMLLGHNDDGHDELAAVFDTVFDTVGVVPIITLLKNLATAVLDDPHRLRAAVQGALSAAS